MRTKVTLVLLFLNVALFFFIFKFERAWRTAAELTEARRRVLGPEAADIRWLEVTNAAQSAGSFALRRDGEAWKLLRPLEWPANPVAVSRILLDLQLLEHVSSFSAKDLAASGQSLADYGLDKPRLKVEFRSGANPDTPPTRLELGDITKVGERLYLRTLADDRIHVVSRTLADSLALPLAQLRADTLLTIPLVEVRSLSIRTAAAGAPVRVRRDGARWKFETPINALASKLEFDVVINSLHALHAANFSPVPPPATLPAAAPALTLGLEGNSRRETLFLGEPVAPAGGAAAPAGTDVELFAQLQGRSALFTVAVPARLLEKLRNAQEALRERRILDFDARNVTAVTLTAPNRDSLTLQRDPAAPADSPWQVVRRTNPPVPPLAADPAAVKRLLAQLGALAATKFQSDAPSAAELENWGFNRPEREVTLNFTGSAPPLVLQLGTDARQDVYARLGPASASIYVYAVPAEILRELPVAPREWRDRLVRELPAAARITALKLSDLATSATLCDLALEADGKPKSETAHPAAVAAVVAHLRTLRARAFVQDAFAERFVFAGEERTWRYRLDATVSLPGGAGGEQASVSSLWLTVRGGGDRQLAGARDADAVFELEQSFLDELWKLTYGARDPGPGPAAPPKTP